MFHYLIYQKNEGFTISEINILIGGEAGDGIARSAEMLGKAFANLGQYVFNYRSYMSLIRGGHSFNIVTVADKPVHSHRETIDVLIAFDERTLNNHKGKVKENGYIIGNASLEVEQNFIPLEIDTMIEELGIKEIMKNVVYLGALFKTIGMNLDPLLQVLKEVFDKVYEANKKAAEAGFERAKQSITYDVEERESNYFISGTEAMGIGAIESGLDVYIAYPMTPSTPLLHFLASKQFDYEFLTTQVENEIAVANAALGASFAGAMSMVGTSGGGFALMSAMMSHQGMSEIPLVAYLCQRPGPSVGLATRQAQGDLKFALSPGHGEFPKVVLTPGDPMETYQKTAEAFYLSQKYRTLSILLADKHLVESNYTYDTFEELNIQPTLNIEEDSPKDYKSYELTETGVSPRVVPGQGPVVKANGDEHTVKGYTTEDPEITMDMNEKRFRKFDHLKKEVKKEFEMTKTFGDGEILLLGWGSTKGAIIDAMQEFDNFRYLHLLYLSPFPSAKVREEIGDAEKVVLIENNVNGLLGDVIREKTGLTVDEKILKYDGRPLNKTWLVRKLEEVK